MLARSRAVCLRVCCCQRSPWFPSHKSSGSRPATDLPQPLTDVPSSSAQPGADLVSPGEERTSSQLGRTAPRPSAASLPVADPKKYPAQKLQPCSRQLPFLPQRSCWGGDGEVARPLGSSLGPSGPRGRAKLCPLSPRAACRSKGRPAEEAAGAWCSAGVRGSQARELTRRSRL